MLVRFHVSGCSHLRFSFQNLFETHQRLSYDYCQGRKYFYLPVTYDNGDVYTGETLNGCPHGYGKYDFKCHGETFEGKWLFGIPDGLGKKVYRCGTSFEGKWLIGKPHGSGNLVRCWSVDACSRKCHFQ
jgi:hypothetical protein